jgi:hypothetical protein
MDENDPDLEMFQALDRFITTGEDMMNSMIPDPDGGGIAPDEKMRAFQDAGLDANRIAENFGYA